jgi:tRNA threonylcarbamoyl adenosine modification protein YeaZ
MILAINTTSNEHELALIEEGELISEERWRSNRDDVERLVPTLKGMLDEAGLEKSEITDVLVITGPGPFTAIRTGVSFANGLAEGLGAKLYAMDTFELLKKKVASSEPVIAILHAGGLDVAVSEEEVKVGALSSLLAPFTHHKYKVVAEIKEVHHDELHSICLEKGWEQVEGHKLQTLGEVVLTYGLPEPVEMAEAYYLRGPMITKSSNPWKKP